MQKVRGPKPSHFLLKQLNINYPAERAVTAAVAVQEGCLIYARCSTDSGIRVHLSRGR